MAILLGFVVLGIIPLVWMALAPSKTGQELQNLSPFAFGSFDNYFKAWDNLQAFSNAVILRWVVNSAVYTSVIVILSVASATLAGFVLAAAATAGPYGCGAAGEPEGAEFRGRLGAIGRVGIWGGSAWRGAGGPGPGD